MILFRQWAIRLIVLATCSPMAHAQAGCMSLAAIHDHKRAWLVDTSIGVRLVQKYAVSTSSTLSRVLFDCERSRLILLTNSRTHGASATIYPFESKSNGRPVQVSLPGVYVVNHAFAARGMFWVFGGKPLRAETHRKQRKVDWKSVGLRDQERWFSGAFGFDSVTGQPTGIFPMPIPGSGYIRRLNQNHVLLGSNPPIEVDMKRHSARRPLDWRIRSVPYPVQTRAVAQFIGENAFYVEGSGTGPGSKSQIRRYDPGGNRWPAVAEPPFDPHFFHYLNDRIVLIGDHRSAVFKPEDASLQVADLPFNTVAREMRGKTFSGAAVNGGYLLSRVRRVSGSRETIQYSSVVTVHLLSVDLNRELASLEIRPVTSAPSIVSPLTIDKRQYGLLRTD